MTDQGANDMECQVTAVCEVAAKMLSESKR
ncbi:hypothetical protein DYBT9275_03756 [Dyadobacter sp. CECT 9275]|uniref:Uncharacterized protein n=1 Tax=Dyadobacter helix TaxID=2822344 RepID=A0A916JF74_9BACT|nr:hypothetical protein DYBT9275_03756 [Dyadobacter sp. CECT 9275]